ncbi:MAG: thioredoxin domain-containing protein [Bdellovibrionota bacterium]
MNAYQLRVCTTFAILFTLSSCAPTASQMTSLLEKHPEILTKAIEKNPEKFIEAIQNASRAKRSKGNGNDEKRMEAEFANPLKPEIDPKRAFKGSSDAPITIVEYTDFQCPFCARGHQTVKQVKKAYDGKVKLIVKHLPLPMHPMAMPAAIRFEAIMLQSSKKAFAFYDEVFDNQEKLKTNGEKYLDSVVKKVGANLSRVKKDMKSEKISALIAKDMAEAKSFGIKGTPGFVVNGVSIRGARPIATFKKVIDRNLASSP